VGIVHYLLTLTLRSWWGVAGYTFVITALAVAAAVMLISVLPIVGPRELWHYRIAFYIAVIIAPPFGLFGGWHLLRVTRLSKQLADTVARDRLSGAATRDYFFDHLINESPRMGIALMVDIDHFKRVNDTFGHIAGDAVIRSVAGVLQAATRKEDVVCRFGGEEFVVFLSEANPSFAERIAERITDAVRDAQIDWKGESLQVTVSVGGAQLERLDDLEGAMSRADACLYKAKEQGRDRWVMEWQDGKSVAA